MLTGNIYSLKPRKSFRPGRSSFARASFAIAAVCALGAIVVAATSLASVFQFPRRLPPNTTIGGVPVGGLTTAAAQARLTNQFFLPLHLNYEQEQISLAPETVGFKLDLDETIAQIPVGTGPNLWGSLLGRTPTAPPTTARLIASVNDEKLTAFLHDVASRYDTPPGVAAADATAMVTVINAPGRTLNIATAARSITSALLSPTNRFVQLQSQSGTTLHPHLTLLEAQIRKYMELQQFTGLLSFFLIDLQNNQRLHFNTLNGSTLPTDPDIAFSGMSILKIPIMAEFYRQSNDDALPYEQDLVVKSITQSSNWTTNLLIAWIGDQSTANGLYTLNTSLAKLSMTGTFIGGAYDSTDAPGFRYTPANKRTDISTAPDAYMQTTPSDMGRLLEAIYQCSEDQPNLLTDTFPGAYSKTECTTMLELLADNQIAVLVQAGVPEGVRVAHKHAWADGEPIGDAAVVYTPGGDYVLVYYLWVPGNTYWDENSRRMADISRAVYYFFNPLLQTSLGATSP